MKYIPILVDFGIYIQSGTMEEKKVYSNLSERAQELAPQIEKLLNGLSFREVESLIFELLDEIKKKAIITSSS